MRILNKIDHFIGQYIPVQEVGWTEKLNMYPESELTMDDLEWGLYRDKERDKDVAPLIAWLRLLSTKESRKFHIFEAIYKIFQENDYSSVLEIGSGQCHISALLASAGYKVQASEIGAQKLLIQDISDLNLPVREQRLEDINGDILQDIDCILAVQVDYIFNDKALRELLKTAKKTATDILLVNTQIIGPLQWLKYLFQKETRSRNINIKEHGFVRSIGLYKKMAKELGFQITVNRKLNALPSYYFILMSNH